MSFEKVSDLMGLATRYNTSILAFDACDINMIAAVVQGAEKANKPAIVMLYPGLREMLPMSAFASATKYYAERVKVPVGLHLDHCSDFDLILQAIRAGFTSVMADGSELPLEENIAFTRSVVRVSKNFGVDVEGEVVHVGNTDSGDGFRNKEAFTHPGEASRFAEETGVQLLAVSFGSAHGFYKHEPKLDIEHLKELDRATDVPLVLHGGTGIPDKQLREAFASGINKINIGTEYFALNTKLNQEFYARKLAGMEQFEGHTHIRPTLADYVAGRLALCKVEL